MVRFVLPFVAAMSLPIEAQALSCIAPNTAGSFLNAQAAEEPYFVVMGQITFDASLMPHPVNTDATETTWIPARLQGLGLGEDGFTRPFAGDVNLHVTCWNIWCGSIVNDRDYLVFVRMAEKVGNTIEVEPCPRFVFWEPTPEQIAVVEACYRGERCEQGMGSY